MARKSVKSSVTAAVGAAFVTSLAGVPAQATDNPFTITELSSGYMVADKQGEGKCGEGKCGDKRQEKQAKEGKCGGSTKQEQAKGKEGKGGEGRCGGSR